MNKRLCVLALSCVFLVGCGVRLLWPVLGPDAWKPRVACDAPSFDFGQIRLGQAAEHTFVIRNTGLRKLNILHVIPTCGCTKATVAEKVVAPFRSTTVLATLSGVSSENAPWRNVKIVTNDPRKPTLTLRLRGTAAKDADPVKAR